MFVQPRAAGGDVIVGASSDDHPQDERPRDAASVGRTGHGPQRRGLVAACLRGDQDAWETLVRSHAGLVYTMIRRCGATEDETADVFQEVWLAAWDGLASLRDERGLASWLATVAARTATRALRRRIRHPVATGEQFEAEVLLARDPDPRPDDVVLEREQGAEVRAAIAALPERDQKLVHYFFYDPGNPSYVEIAARIGVSPETVGPLRTRCLRRLRAALRDAPGLVGPER